MPTGYTYGIANGSVTTLREFALTAARAMGALVPMRDAPANAPIPRRFEPETKHLDEKLAEAQARFAELSAMDEALRRESCAVYNTSAEAQNVAMVATNKARRERYDAMIAKVVAWEGAPEGLKEFMLEQLRTSRESDCLTDADIQKSWKPALSVDDWYRAQLDRVVDDIGSYEQSRAEEIARTTRRNAWLARLWAALPPEGAE